MAKGKGPGQVFGNRFKKKADRTLNAMTRRMAIEPPLRI